MSSFILALITEQKQRLKISKPFLLRHHLFKNNEKFGS